LRSVTLHLQLMETVGINGIYKCFFPFLVYKISFTYNKKMHDKKKDLFSNLSEFTLGNGPLRILEIGCGSGSLAVNDHLMFESFVVASGEDIGAVKNKSVDVVVCSVNDIPRTLQEAHRILRPVNCLVHPWDINTMGPRSHHTAKEGDAFCLLEMDFRDGCEGVRATWKDLEATGFSELQLRHHSTS
uniref:Methyltransferase domain-containing protein n=1 Tax=Oncorhynchus mykiss TaxID=8022 RepID=A0A8K9UGV0_ONCMY